jgi:hypothetical protein
MIVFIYKAIHVEISTIQVNFRTPEYALTTTLLSGIAVITAAIPITRAFPYLILPNIRKNRLKISVLPLYSELPPAA